MLFSSQMPFASHLILPTWPNAVTGAQSWVLLSPLNVCSKQNSTSYTQSCTTTLHINDSTCGQDLHNASVCLSSISLTPDLSRVRPPSPPFSSSLLFSLTHSIQTPLLTPSSAPKTKNNTFANPLLPTRAFPPILGHIHHPLLLVHAAPSLLRPRLQFPSGLSPCRRKQQCRRRQRQQWSETTRGREWQRR